MITSIIKKIVEGILLAIARFLIDALRDYSRKSKAKSKKKKVDQAVKDIKSKDRERKLNGGNKIEDIITNK